MNWIFKVGIGLLLFGLINGATARPAPGMTAAGVEQWADELFRQAMQEHRFAGAVVSYVEDGAMVFSRGYGYADYVAGTPVDPASTTFRVGSISKTFTATAIAQLLDQGLIGSLADPANRYLKRIQLPSPGGRDITLRQLITHTAGFENRVFHIASDRTLELPLSTTALAPFAAEVVNEPGRYASYNNFGTAVLGLVVEDVSGVPVAEYFERHIFQPLGMDHTMLNMSPDPSPGLGVSYGFMPSGEPLLIPHRSVHPFYAPVGGINASAEDMARFMLAHLDAGRSAPNPLMSTAVFSQMHSRLAGNHPLSSGFGMIFFVWDWNGQKMIVHGGDWPGTHSGMVLFPELNKGLFFSLMADYPEVPVLATITGSERLEAADGIVVEPPLSNTGVIVDFLTHFLGPPRAPRQEGFHAADLQEFEGNYVAQSAAHSTMEVMLNFTNPFSTVRVQAGEQGGLMINGKGPYREIAPDVFWSEQAQMALDGFFLDSPAYFFVRDADGAVDFLTPQIGFDAWVKKSIWGTPFTYLAAWGLLMLFLLSGLICLFYPTVPGHRLVKWLPPSIAILMIAMPLMLLAFRGEQQTLVSDLFFGHAMRFAGFTVLANGVIVLALATAWFSVRAWAEPYWSGRRFAGLMRTHYTALSLAALLLIPVFSYANLLIL